MISPGAVDRPTVADRLDAQMLAGRPARDPVAVVDRLLAVQAQDPRGARLAIRARSTGLTAASIDDALTVDRSLVVSWLNRGTLHLVRREDYAWLHALTTPGIATGNARRLEQEGVSPTQADRGVEVIARSLDHDGPSTRAQLRDRLDAAGVPTAGQALVHVLVLATLRGLVVRGPMVGHEQAFVLARDWLGEPEAVDRDLALAELARRYLAAHAPADDRDLAKWSGLPLRDARAGLRTIASELHERPDGLLERKRRRAPASMPPPRLLGAFDPLLLGWTSRQPILGDHTGVVTTNGIFRPVALVDGRAVATWTLPNGEFALDPFDALEADVTTALARDAADVVAFLSPSTETSC